MDHRQGKHGGNEWLKVCQVEWQVKDPGCDDHEGNGKHCNLDGGAQGHPNGQVHFVSHGNKHCRDVFTGIASNGKNDEPQEHLVEARLGADSLNGSSQKPGGEKHTLLDSKRVSQRAVGKV